jgi:hypothetical protein
LQDLNGQNGLRPADCDHTGPDRSDDFGPGFFFGQDCAPYWDFPPEAGEFAKVNSMTLIDGPKLTRMIVSVQQSGNLRPKQEGPVQACPQCGSAMVLGEARKGPHAGKKF